MIASVIVNKLTVVHKMSDGISTASPDTCLTPAPPGPPVPIAYTNVAFSRDLANEARTVFADGQGIALSDSFFAISTGDEPGTALGIVSGVIKGKATFVNYSMDVLAEGKNVCRLGDPMLNNGNTPNTPPAPETQSNQLPADLEQKLCKIFCWCNKRGNKGSDFIQKVPVVPTKA
ncbi:MAG TPA: DUF4150 domain-containing protein [Bryobacteraceae bacterium]|nr:DUF4150 domain-containing protein [Bryobacteraceae bacterium]